MFYLFRQTAPSADYKVHLNLKKPSVNEDIKEIETMFSGLGKSPYEAMREASKKAREYLTNINGEFSSHSNGSNGSTVDKINNGRFICT